MTIEDRIEEIKRLLRLDHLNQDEYDHVENLIKNNADRFQMPGEPLEATNILRHSIPTTDDCPIFSRQYRFPQIHKDEITKQVNELLKNKIIKPSQSPYNTPVWIVPKKPDSSGNLKWRMVLDFRKLNEKTIGDSYPLPHINDILDSISSAKYFSVFDLATGFHHIRMNPNDSHKTAFSTPHGHYEFDRMPFGLKTAPATFQRLMDLTLTGLIGTELFVYLDDIVIYADTLEEHERKFNNLAERLRNANLHLQPDKCEFLRPEVGYLGHIIDKNGVRPDPRKIIAVKNFPIPKTTKNIKQFLGLAGYYRRFIENFSKIAHPLNQLLKKDTPFIWSDKQQLAFDTLKQHLCEEPLLQRPDFSQPFVLTTDASGYAIGGILSQGKIGKDKPIAYASRSLSDTEKKYDTYEKEALAIIFCVSHFRPYLYGRKFTLVTDHKPLVWFQNSKDPCSRVSRWRLKLAEYNYEVVYKAGKMNVNADALSRNPIPNEEELFRNQKVLDDDTFLTFGDNKKSSENIHDSNNTSTLLLLLTTLLNPILSDYITNTQWKTILTRAQRKLEETGIQEKLTENVEKILQPIIKRSRGRPKKLKNKLPIQEDKVGTKRRGRPRKDKKPISEAEEETDPEYFDELRRNKRLKRTKGKKKNKIVIQEKPNEDNETYFSSTEDDSSKEDDDIFEESLDEEFYEEENEIFQDAMDNEEIFEEKDKIQESEIEENNKDKGRNLRRKEEITQAPPVQEKQSTSNKILIECRDQLTMRKDNYLYFVSTNGTPLDNGSKSLTKKSILPKFNNLQKGLVKEFKKGKYYHFALPIQENVKENLTDTLNTIKSCFNSLLSISDKLNICKIRQQILEENHSSAIGGHKGVTKTLARIRQKYYWENLKTDIQKYINGCLQCQLKKLVRVKTKNPMIITDTPTTAFEKISMDIVGPFNPPTKSGNTYILTIQDNFTKYSLAIPLPNHQAATIADAFVKKFICIFGSPKGVLTDQGRDFLSNLLKRLAKRFRIKQFRTTAFHPQSNGSLERSHHVLAEYLKQFIEKNSEWDDWLELAMFSYNTSIHEGTKCTPYELVFGKLAREPSSESPSQNEKLQTYDEYLTTFVTQLHEMRAQARENLISVFIGTGLLSATYK
ncbi:uncharacterized protein LOC122507359 [Leptopilina heterotoma]|uniref:uncharacterized protein LOC122507359 n=1 Tax=Leptopilina heterotoma TaxID=63436 RepID=UPI001CA956EB|nr:uncharacterized protein LOC122507359 [Leptopilina heterotoma]